ncbi:MAG TPA: element excision factor XisI family protein [Blastocatellia bacterium]|nr:element excision factor XisI family protein [Blastocatellia bacterium]HMX24485.1 element excision factor XisI family protein [Blastocatellia bacterium]HMY73206.1 element excision factor XisI family protein [Blastocatellia bacterium]HMZ22044.1 element excision factor XisI family protein [Blastocatellia bacterium]HNG30057.1 element excision factor XisI family protein [Blastocatellia bacterium]
MDKIKRYRQILQQVMEDTATMLSQGNEVAILPVCDSIHDQYLMISLGWHKIGRREHAIVFHAQLREGRVLIETDRVEESVTSFLIEAGIEETDIEFAWNRKRQSERRQAILPDNAEAVAA